MTMTVTGGFNIGQADSIRTVLLTDAYQLADYFSLVRGRHQMRFGGNLAFWISESELNARSGGLWQFNGSQTGLGLVDFLAGRMFRLEQVAPMYCRSIRRISASMRRTRGAPPHG